MITPLLHFTKTNNVPHPKSFQKFLEISTFYHIFISFHSGYGVQYLK